MPTRRVRPNRRHRRKRNSDAPNQPFRLLELPAELRNRVYEYVLSAPDDLTVRWQTGKNRRSRKPVMMTNTDNKADTYPVIAQRDCRFGDTFSQVKFIDFPRIQGNAMVGFFVFAGTCTQKNLAWLTRAELVGAAKPTGYGETGYRLMLLWILQECIHVTKLLSFSSQHPHVSIRMQVPGFSFQQGPTMMPRQFVLSGTILEYLMRGRDIVFALGGKKERLKVMDSMLKGNLPFSLEQFKGMCLSAPKLRFCPYTQGFTEVAFEERIHSESATPEEDMYLADGGADF